MSETGGKTLKDLGRQPRRFVATVSRALAGSDRIAASTRERVSEAARAAGYVPNRTARALVSGRSDFAGLVLPIRGPGLEDAFLGELVSGLGSGLAAHGIDLFLATVPEGKTELSVIEHIVEARRADGLVLARTAEDDPRVAYLARARLSVRGAWPGARSGAGLRLARHRRRRRLRRGLRAALRPRAPAFRASSPSTSR